MKKERIYTWNLFGRIWNLELYFDRIRKTLGLGAHFQLSWVPTADSYKCLLIDIRFLSLRFSLLFDCYKDDDNGE